MKYWLLWAMVTIYDGGYPDVKQEFVTYLPELANCAEIRQAISMDLNRLEGGVSYFLQCEDRPSNLPQGGP